MVDQVGRHAQARRIADAEVALERRFERHRRGGRAMAGDMLGLPQAEVTQHETGEHFRGEGAGEIRMPVPDLFPVGHAQLAAAVDRRGAVQVADARDPGRVGLPPRQRVHDIVEVAHAPVGARQHHRAGVQPAGFLQGTLRRRLSNWSGSTSPSHSAMVRSHSLAMTRSLRFSGARYWENSTKLNRPLGVDAVDRGAVAIGVQLEARGVHPPALAHDPAHQGAHEAQAALMQAAQPFQIHDLAGRAHGQGRGFGLAGFPVLSVFILGLSMEWRRASATAWRTAGCEASMCRRYWDRLTGGAIQIGLLLDKQNLWRDCFDEWGCSVPGGEAVVAQDEVEQRLGGHRQRAIGQAHQADVAAGEARPAE